ncbi:MAG: hypothetical protein CMG22_03465, partial [Candidatus Marinimicrobia bacterium]|nr:hypothetical protein [Candidatus Neomarinimicrobiota bacterium]
MKKIVLLLTFLLNGYTIAGNNDDAGTNSSTPTLPSNYDSGGSYHTAAVLTVLQEYSDYTTVNGWWSDAQY